MCLTEAIKILLELARYVFITWYSLMLQSLAQEYHWIERHSRQQVSPLLSNGPVSKAQCIYIYVLITIQVRVPWSYKNIILHFLSKSHSQTHERASGLCTIIYIRIFIQAKHKPTCLNKNTSKYLDCYSILTFESFSLLDFKLFF